MRIRVPAVVAAVLLVVPVPVLADDGLGDYLEHDAGAEFHGTGVVMCTWESDSAAATYEVTRHEGMSMTSGPSGDLMVTPAITVMRAGGEWYSVEFSDRSEWSLSDRYRLGAVTPTVHLGRAASAYLVLEGDLPRVRLIVDDLTTVPLVTEVLDADGRVFRMAVLIAFDDTPGDMPPPPEAARTRTVPSAQAGASLPESIAGYRRVDTYEIAGGGLQGYYSDGLFSFSVFEKVRGSTPEAFRGATTFMVGDGRYRRVVTPSEVWVYWNAPDRSYVLVGDLPPDHLLAALDGLPDPGDRGLLVRLWRRLFG